MGIEIQFVPDVLCEWSLTEWKLLLNMKETEEPSTGFCQRLKRKRSAQNIGHRQSRSKTLKSKGVTGLRRDSSSFSEKRNVYGVRFFEVFCVCNKESVSAVRLKEESFLLTVLLIECEHTTFPKEFGRDFQYVSALTKCPFYISVRLERVDCISVKKC